MVDYNKLQDFFKKNEQFSLGSRDVKAKLSSADEKIFSSISGETIAPSEPGYIITYSRPGGEDKHQEWVPKAIFEQSYASGTLGFGSYKKKDSALLSAVRLDEDVVAFDEKGDEKPFKKGDVLIKTPEGDFFGMEYHKANLFFQPKDVQAWDAVERKAQSLLYSQKSDEGLTSINELPQELQFKARRLVLMIEQNLVGEEWENLLSKSSDLPRTLAGPDGQPIIAYALSKGDIFKARDLVREDFDLDAKTRSNESSQEAFKKWFEDEANYAAALSKLKEKREKLEKSIIKPSDSDVAELSNLKTDLMEKETLKSRSLFLLGQAAREDGLKKTTSHERKM